MQPECDVSVPGIPGTGNFSFFLVVSEPVSEQIGTGKKSRNRYWKNLVLEKVSEPVLVKFGIGKKSQNQHRKYLVPETSIGIGIV